MGEPSLEVAILAAVVAAALLPALSFGLRLRGVRLLGAAVAVFSVSAGGFAWAAHTLQPPLVPESAIPDRPVREPRDGYVSSVTCQGCHPTPYHSWHASFHRTMTQVATPETVAGDFDDVRVAFHGAHYRLFRRGDEFWVEMEDPAHAGPGPAPRIERRIVMTTGSHHDQDYWYATPGGGRDLRLLPLDWRVEEQRWIPYLSSFMLPPGSRFHYEQSNWTQVCIKCHTTYGEQSVDATSGEIDARAAEMGIACEACHGPAREHVEANRDPQRRYRLHLSGDPDPTIVNPKRLPPPQAAQVCGQCHGQWVERRAGSDLMDGPHRYRPGDDLYEHRIYLEYRSADDRFRAEDPQKHATMNHLLTQMPDYLRAKFWSDGMVRVSGREYSGVIASPCWKGQQLSCLSCHRLHREPDDPRPLEEWRIDQLGAGMGGDEACLQCHPAFRGPEALGAHTHHAPGSVSCYDCHMPHTTYGILKAHRSHRIDSPSVQASLETGRPNACNLCHLDRSLAWTAEHLEARYGVEAPELTREQREIAASALWALRGDAGQRILIAWHMGWEPALAVSGEEWMVPILKELVQDPYDAVRFVAGRSLGRHPGYDDIDYDYVAGPEHLRRTAQAIDARWASRQHEARGRSLLQQQDGALDLALLSRLLAERDQRPVSLHE